MPTIFDLVNAKEIAAYYENNPSNKVPYLGSTLFPAKKQLGLDLSWIKGSNGLPVALTPSEFDTKATVRDRIGFSKIQTEMPFFRESMRIGEKDRQELNRLLASNLQEAYKSIVNNIYDDVSTLVKGAEVQPERMIMQLLSSGKIAITSVAVYNKKYRAEDGSLHNFYPDNHFTLIPDGKLGSTYYGTTPEESDLMTGATKADVSIDNTGVAVTSVKEEHPVNVMTIVSEIVLPSFETIDNIFIAKVAGN